MYAMGNVARISGLTRKVVDDWVKANIAPVSYPARGTGNHRRFSYIDLVAILTARSIRQHGGTLPMMRAAVQSIAASTEAELRQSIAAGKDRVVLIGDQPVEGIFALDELNRSAALKAVREAMVPITIINLAGIIEALDKRIAEVMQTSTN